ncbi:hypothetical protein PBF_02160 [Cytobacillus firmus DS1]|uniref:Uncharacterized protein n=2 Tax=Cytobacillus firmus TaxID=1399 RepID=W7LD99_CYTFI|nr:hypothetical protein PBF_02160 [Cytobacillus firmus DS1]
MNIVRTMRNSVHTNGVYDPKPNRHGTQHPFNETYRKLYRYNVGDKVIFGWTDLEEFIKGSIELLVELMKDPKVISIPNNQMIDPSA